MRNQPEPSISHKDHLTKHDSASQRESPAGNSAKQDCKVLPDAVVFTEPLVNTWRRKRVICADGRTRVNVSSEIRGSGLVVEFTRGLQMGATRNNEIKLFFCADANLAKHRSHPRCPRTEPFVELKDFQYSLRFGTK